MPTPTLEDIESNPSVKQFEEIRQLFIKNARTFQDFTALTPESMEVIYTIAYNQYSAGKYETAEKVFRLLTTLNHFDRKYWKGLAAAREALNMHTEALACYAYLGIFDPSDPYPAFKGAKCFLALGKRPEAEAGFRAAIFNSDNKPEHAELHAQAKGLLELVQNQDRKDASAGNGATAP